MKVMLALSALLMTAALASASGGARIGNVTLMAPFYGLKAYKAIIAEIASNKSCRNTEFKHLGASGKTHKDRAFHSARIIWECDEAANMPEFNQSAKVQYFFHTDALSAPIGETPSLSSKDLQMGFFSVRVSALQTELKP